MDDSLNITYTKGMINSFKNTTKDKISLRIISETLENLELLLTTTKWIGLEVQKFDGQNKKPLVILIGDYLIRLGSIGTLTYNQISHTLYNSFNPNTNQGKIPVDRLKEEYPQLHNYLFGPFSKVYRNGLQPLRNQAAHRSLFDIIKTEVQPIEAQAETLRSYVIENISDEDFKLLRKSEDEINKFIERGISNSLEYEETGIKKPGYRINIEELIDYVGHRVDLDRLGDSDYVSPMRSKKEDLVFKLKKRIEQRLILETQGEAYGIIDFFDDYSQTPSPLNEGKGLSLLEKVELIKLNVFAAVRAVYDELRKIESSDKSNYLKEIK